MVDGATSLVEDAEFTVMKALPQGAVEINGLPTEEKMTRVLHVLRDYYKVIVKCD